MSLLKHPAKNVIFLAGFLIFLSLLNGCDSQHKSAFTLSGETMGTTYHITIAADQLNETQESLKKAIDSRLVEINQSFSTYIGSSEVSVFNDSKGQQWHKKSKEFINVLAHAQKISDITEGAYDITVGPLVNLWGFGPTFNVDEMPTEVQIKEVLASVGYQNIAYNLDTLEIKKLNDKVYIDFSSIAKGYAVDEIAELIESRGYSNFMVEIGGEMRLRGKNAQNTLWRIAIEKPDSKNRSIHRVLKVSDTAIATSGDYRNFFEKDGVRFSHTINPTNGQPVQHKLASVTVLAENSMKADAWATAFMVLGHKKGYDLAVYNRLAVLFLVKDGDSIREITTPEFTLMTQGLLS